MRIAEICVVLSGEGVELNAEVRRLVREEFAASPRSSNFELAQRVIERLS